MKIEVLNHISSDDEQFDLLIFAVGYEARARYIAEKYASRSKAILGYQFPEGHILSFDDNKKFLSDAGGLQMVASETIEEILRKQGAESFRDRHICLDVSSLNRGTMSALMSELLESHFFSGCTVSILYAVAEFTKPSREEVDFLDFGPLVNFSGWTSNPERPTTLLVGLGYEADHAIGALEYLDPSAAFAFFPNGHEELFADEVRKANKTFFEVVGMDRVVDYPVQSPYQTYWQMRSLILSLSSVSRVVLVPMGPKIFCSLCLICQKVLGDEISVWRASGHTLATARESNAAGPISGYTIQRENEHSSSVSTT